MVDGTGPSPNVETEHKQRLHNPALAPIKRRPPIQLRRRHPQPLLRINPHSIHPQKSGILQNRLNETSRTNFQDRLSLRIAHIQIAMLVDRRAARAGSQREGLDIGA